MKAIIYASITRNELGAALHECRKQNDNQKGIAIQFLNR